MEPEDRAGPLERRAEPAAPLPARRLSAMEVEAVLRRAVQLQAREGDAGASAAEGMSEAELVKIGEELGLTSAHIQQAIAETSVHRSTEEQGWFGRGFGPAEASATRLIRRPADEVRAELDRYFREHEYMVVERRFPDRVQYCKAKGLSADLGRMTAALNQRYPRLDVPEVEVAVRQADASSCYVALRVSMRPQRTGLAAGGLVAGGSAGGTAAVFLGIAVAPIAAAAGLPLFLVGVWGMRSVYRHTYNRKVNQLESLLDRLEHRELLPPPSPSWRHRLGL